MPERPINTRTLGRVVAVSVGLVFIGIVGLFAVSGKGRSTASKPAPPLDPSVPAPQDIAATGLSAMGKARVQYVAANDPSKVLGLIEWAQIDPLPGGKSVVEKPKATVFLSPTARVVINADRGTLFARPPAVEPESGVFEGNVTARYFILPPGPGGQPAALPPDSRPAVEFSTSAINFDLALGEATASGNFTLTGSGIDAAGSGLRIVANQVQNRIELLRVDRTTRLQLSPSRLRELSDSVAASTRAAEQPPAAPPGPAPTAVTPRTTLYRIALGPDLTIANPQVTVSADRLEAFATTIDGKLAPGSVAPLSMLTPPRTVLPGPVKPPAEASPTAGPDPADPNRPARDQIEVRFAGPLEVRPAAAIPAELTGQLAGLSLLGLSKPATIALSGYGSASTSSVSFSEGWYGATKPAIRLGGSRAPIEFAADAGRVSAAGLKADLTSGAFQLSGPGTAIAYPNRDETAPIVIPELPPETGSTALVGPPLMRQLEWSEQLDIGILTDQGRLTDRLTFALAQGNVLARDRSGSASAGAVRLDFAANPSDPSTPSAAGSTFLHRVTLSEGARLQAIDEREGVLGGESVVIGLLPLPSGDSSPLAISQITATGRTDVAQTASQPGPDRRAFASRRGASLRSGFIDASLVSDEQNRPTLRNVRAERSVEFRDDRGTFAKADQLTAEAESQVVDLIGKDVSIGRTGVEIIGTQMRLDGLRRELYVHGAGRLVAMQQGGRSSLETVWNEFLRFDDDKGDAESRGNTVTVARRDRTQVDTLRAEAMRLTFEPLSLSNRPEGGTSSAQSPQATTAAQPVSASAVERKLLKVEAIGRSVGQPGGPQATVDIRRYAKVDGAAEGPLEQLIFLISDRIIASPANATLDVPGPGQLLVDDHRQPRNLPVAPAGQSGSDSLFSSGRAGTSFFTWGGSMGFRQSEGLMQMRDNVELRQQARGAAAPVLMTCSMIEARLQPPIAGTAPANPAAEGTLMERLGGELISAAAKGNVEVTSPDKRRMTAGRVEFDAARQVIAAHGDIEPVDSPAPTADPARVTFSDPSRPTPLVARALKWFLQTGRIEIVEPMPVSTPR